MNNFLQRMLKKSDVQSDGEMITYERKNQHVEVSPRSSSSSNSNKSNWMRKLGGGYSSPNKRDFSPSMKSLSRPITPQRRSDVHRNDYRRKSVPEPLTTRIEESTTNTEMPDLEKIIHEFEEGFLSPSKHETRATIESGRFVKQIVAAFEEKYKIYNDHKMEAEKYWKDERERPMNTDDSIGIPNVLDSCETKSSVVSSCRSDESINFDMSCSFAMDEELAVSTPTKETADSSNRWINGESIIFDENREIPSGKSKIPVRSNSSVRRERQPKIIGALLKKPIQVEDTSIDWIPITGKKLPRKRSFKRLLSVLMGKRSSNKSSKLYHSEVNLIPEKNPRELHDSGYDDEKSSCSSSSITSLISMTDVLLEQQKNYHVEVDEGNGTTFHQSTADSIATKKDTKNVNFTTFRQVAVDVKQSFQHDHDHDHDDDDDSCSVVSSKKLLLEEIPRSEVRLSLGPSFPLAPRTIDNICDDDYDDDDDDDDDDEIYSTISYDDLSEDDVSYETTVLSSAAAAVSPLPKHPFVSLKKKKFQTNGDAVFDSDNSDTSVELRGDFESWQFPCTEVAHYDIPRRRYMSKSEPGLVMFGKDELAANDTPQHYNDEVVYDVPKANIAQRPRSSVYEDALSLKRRKGNLTCASFGFYGAFPSHDDEEPHYATVKPRNTTRICPSEQLIRSMADLSVFQKSH